jgi:protein gp37
MATKIEWSDETWNPTTGCDRVSAGCDNCYALTMAKRLKGMGSAKYQNDGDPRTSGPGFDLTLHPDTLNAPLAWKKPRKVFVNSMSDLFHARVPLDFVRQVFEVMASTPQHTYQVLTKRASRLPKIADRLEWPANVLIGTSVENAGELHRVDDLRRVPAAARFLSCEPLIGPLDGLDLTGIDWVIVGGEKAARAKPMHPSWARQIRNQCVIAGVPFFFKQWGTWVHDPIYDTSGRWHLVDRDGEVGPVPWSGWGRGRKSETWPGWVPMHRASKGFPDHKTLDGFEWREFPEVAR